MQKERNKLRIGLGSTTATLLFVFFSLYVVAQPLIDSTFPTDNLNASATTGYNAFGTNQSFNANNPQFHCSVQANATGNVTNVSLFLGPTPLDSNAAIRNQTQNSTFINGQQGIVIFNLSSLNQGQYYWFCEGQDNSTSAHANTTLNRTLTIDLTPPGFQDTSISSPTVSTGSIVATGINVTDAFTSISAVRLLVNTSGDVDNVVNQTGPSSGVFAANNASINFTFVITPDLIGQTLNFTFQVNDSVNNINISPTQLVTVTDGTPPGPILLQAPVQNYNSSNSTIVFNFTASDNSNGTLTCTINISQNGVKSSSSIENINATAGVDQLNTSISLADGTYDWSVNCSDQANNENNSLAQSFTVDTVPPFAYNVSITHVSAAVGTTVSLSVVWNDTTTNPEEAYLYVNVSGVATNIVNATNITLQNNRINLSYTLGAGTDLAILNFTMAINDSAGNFNLSAAQSVTVTDSVPPGPLHLVSPIDLFNTSNSELNFTFNATDNAQGVLTCALNISQLGVTIQNITNIEANSSRNQTNSTRGALGSGHYSWSINCTDGSLNTNNSIARNFTVDQIPPSLPTPLQNLTNISLFSSFSLTSTDNLTSVQTLSFSTSCGTSGTFSNGVAFFPFNDTGTTCAGTNSTQTLLLNSTDAVGNSNVTLFSYGIDNLPPNITLLSPTSGSTLANNVSIRWNISETMGKISFIGFYLDNASLPTQLEFSATGIGSSQTPYVANASLNLSQGNHTLILTVNDTFGNSANSTLRTIKVTAPIPISDLITGLNLSLGTQISNAPVFRVKDDNNDYSVVSSNQHNNQTFELLISVNTTSQPFNVTLTDIDGNNVNWENINQTYIRSNNTDAYSHIQNNWSTTVLHMVYTNQSIEQYAPNTNHYYGMITLPVNTSLVQEIMWFSDRDDLSSRSVLSSCSSAFTASSSTPCYNSTSQGRLFVFVPHYGILAAANDTVPPTFTVITPDPNEGNHSTGELIPRIAVSEDTSSCHYSINTTNTNTNISMSLSGGVCTGSSVRLKNNNDLYNITFTVIDGSGNRRTEVFYLNISDTTPPKTIVSSDVSESESQTSATITLSNMNESVNATVFFGTNDTQLTSVAFEVDFATSQDISLANLSASTTYYYNITACDYNGNCVKNGTYSFTTDSSSSSTSSSSSGSSGGGSGGSGGGTTTSSTSSTSRLWSSINAGTTATMDVDDSNIAVTLILFSPTSTLSNAELLVSSLDSNPESSSPGDVVYQYLDISSTNIDDDDFAEATIEFSVPSSWITDNAIDTETIALYRYTSSWQELTTVIENSGSSTYTFSSRTPGFSSFAIAGETLTDQQNQDDTTTPGDQNNDPTQDDSEGSGTTITPTDEPVEFNFTYFWVALIVVLILFAGGFFVWHQKRIIAEATMHDQTIDDMDGGAGSMSDSPPPPGSPPKEMATIFLHATGKFVGQDYNTYGPFMEGQVANLPPYIAKKLADKRIVKILEK